MKKFFIIIFLLILGVGTYVGITKGIDFTEREQTVKTDKIENIGHTDTDPEEISQEENIQEPDSVSKPMKCRKRNPINQVFRSRNG